MFLAMAVLAAFVAPAEHYLPPRPAFAGFHVAMPEDSAFWLMHRVALRHDTLHVDSIIILESDSVQIFGQPAYIQLQIADHRVRTIEINWFPLGGGAYLGLRDVLQSYLERCFGRGVVFSDETLVYHRWETEDGTSEFSQSDKYMRLFVRLGKPRVGTAP